MTNLVEKDRVKVKIKRKEHPNAVKYPGRPSLEFGMAVRKFLCEQLKGNQVTLFFEDALVLEEEITVQFFDSLQVGDVVGLGLFKGLNEEETNPDLECAAYKFKVLELNPEADTFKARNVTFEPTKEMIEKKKVPTKYFDYKGLETTISFEQVSCAIAMGFADILERGGKFFGVSEEIEQEVVIVVPEEAKDKNVNQPDVS
jgi:hypothetical protein